MRLQFVGCGDAFGSGGRFNTCLHLTGTQTNVLIDCGASSLVAMKRLGIDRNAIDAIVVTHFHGDHFAGVPFFVLDAQLIAKRQRPLVLAGPPGLRGWYERIFAATFPGERTLPFPLTLIEVEISKPNSVAGVQVMPFPVRHDEKAGPCLAYRIEAEGRVFCYSGDTTWTETLINAARGADLFVCECYVYEKELRAHMSLRALRQNLPAITAKRVVLTHMSDDMLAHTSDVSEACAQDGMIVEF